MAHKGTKQAARKNRSYKTLTFADWVDLARPHSGRGAWKKADGGGYQSARNRGLLDKISTELGWESVEHHDYSKYTLANWVDLARPHGSLSGWAREDPAGYRAARRRDLTGEIAAELGWEPSKRSFSDYTLADWVDLARPYRARTAWQKADGSAYQAARRRGLLDDIAKRLGWW